MDVRAVGVGVGIAASAITWWLLRGRANSHSPGPQRPPPDLSAYVTPVAKITKLCIYPVKSCHRIEVDSTDCLKRGLKYDRCWVIIDKDGSFCHQRKQPAMALIQPELTILENGLVQLTLNAPDMDPLVLTEPKENTDTSTVKVWNMTGEGIDMGDQASTWVSQFLKLDGCRLYYMSPNNKPRQLTQDSNWDDVTLPEDETSFSDWSPVLIISEASLELLNSKLKGTLMEMERFRPNIVVTGCLPHAEDGWGAVRVGAGVVMRGLKPCGRCKMTRVDPEQGLFTGSEPIETLKTYRLHGTVYNGEKDSRYGLAPLFGYNFSALKTGRVSVGDTIYTRA